MQIYVHHPQSSAGGCGCSCITFLCPNMHAGICPAPPRVSATASELSAEAVRGDVPGCVSAMTPPPQATTDRVWSGGGSAEVAPLRLSSISTLSIKDSTSRGPPEASWSTPATPVSSQDHPSHGGMARVTTSGDGSLPDVLPQLLVQNDGPLQRKVGTACTSRSLHDRSTECGFGCINGVKSSCDTCS